VKKVKSGKAVAAFINQLFHFFTFSLFHFDNMTAKTNLKKINQPIS